MEEVSLNMNFAPVVHFTLVLALCAQLAVVDHELEQLDAKNTFLNEEIDEDIYVKVLRSIWIATEDIVHLNFD